MRRAVLVFGNPGNGKSTLADALSKHHGFHPLSVDAIYVAFVANSYPNLSLPDLRLYIAQHYDTILRLDAARESAWCSHLTELILAALQEHDAVVADGYLLYQCKDGIQTVLAEKGIAVFQIKADRFTYTLTSPHLSPGQIAALGQP